jgi:hypothetical protein
MIVTMRFHIHIGWHHVAILLCAVAIGALVHAEGWIWPLKAAAFLLPVSLLAG